MVENNFNRLLLYFLLKLNCNAFVVELLKKKLLLKYIQLNLPQCLIKRVFPYRESNPGRLGENQES